MKPVEVWSVADAPQLKQRLEQRAEPVLLKGLVGGWPAVRAGQAEQTGQAGHAAQQAALGICDYLGRFDRGVEVMATKTRAAARGVMGYNDSLTDFAFVKARMGLAEFMANLRAYLPVDGAPSIAAQCAKVSDVIPGFLGENVLLALPGVVPNFWLGNALTVPVHHDHPYNLACVVAGRRRFTLFAPQQVGNLYIGPLEHTPSGAPISVVHPNPPDLDRYPRYREALASASVAELAPGDALFIPPLWFHQVEALEKVNLLVNYWWPVVGDAGEAADAQLPAPVATLMQAIRVLNALPPHQRDAWAAMFDHYVVQREQEPAAHIPAHWHGVLARRR
jgi:hypothetical protein